MSPEYPPLWQMVSEVALSSQRPPRALHLRALIELPRIADEESVVEDRAASELISELASEMPMDWKWQAPVDAPLRDLRFGKVLPEIAEEITDTFHYLRSPRRDSESYGLFKSEGPRPVALAVTSQNDVPRMKELLSLQLDPGTLSSRVVSRVFAFEGAPRNIISHLLARVAREERQFGASGLLTYVNPNLGFSGTSYVASNWAYLGDEPGTAYKYLDGRYATDRRLVELFGTREIEALRHRLPGRISVSVMPLRPLLIFHYGLRALHASAAGR